jgi:uncharacterized Zn ribbon protein
VIQIATLRKDVIRGAGMAPFVVLALTVTLAVVTANWASAAAPADEPVKTATDAAEADSMADAEAKALELAKKWGVEVTSIRMTANDHMIDYRYRVLDADKATDLFKRQIKPKLIHQETGKVLAVPETAKLGPLRNSNTPQEGKIYWMFFGNAGNLVKAGDKVTVVIGEFRVEDLVVE